MADENAAIELSEYQQGQLRRLRRQPGTSAEVLLWVQTVADAREQGWMPEPIEDVIRCLEWCASDPFHSWQGARAAKMAQGLIPRLQAVIDGEADPNQERDWYIWADESVANHEGWFDVVLPRDMCWALGLDIDAFSSRSEIGDWLRAEFEALQVADDRIEAARKWCSDPPKPPRSRKAA